jgi:chromosome segregation ATPase
MHELTPAEKTFLNGDTFFQSEHDEYEELQAEIQKEGYSLAEIEELRTYYNGCALKQRDMLKDCNKKIRIAESLIRELNKDKTKDESEIPKDQINNTGQPVKRTV